MTPDQRDLLQKYGVYSDSPLGPNDDPCWPKNCRTIFSHLRRLGTVRFQTYQESVSADILLKPWKDQIEQRAERVASFARRCVEDGEGWERLRHTILARLPIEVACPKCRARFWHSEGESAAGKVASRQPCGGGMFGSDEESLKCCTVSVFEDNYENTSVYQEELEPELRRQLGQLGQQRFSGRVYGLREMKGLDVTRFHVKSRRQHDGSQPTIVGDTDNAPAPYGETVLFPFLVVEDKSETPDDNWTEISMSTSFELRHFLGLQDTLYEGSKNDTIWEATPLGWVISYRAEQCSVSAAYIKREENKTQCRILQVWNGHLDAQEDAFQLLLITDYITDWARDIYRMDVIAGLKTHDKTIRSLRFPGGVSPETPGQSSEPNPVSLPINHAKQALPSRVRVEDNRNHPEDPKAAVKDDLRAFDSAHGVIRDARYIRSRFIGLYVTEDNFKILINTTESPDESKKLAANILSCLKEAWRVRRDALDMLEALWTNTDRRSSDGYLPDKMFLVVFTAAAYLTPDWEQTREVGYLAVAEPLVESLLEIAGLHRSPREAAEHPPFVESENLERAFSHFMRCTAEQNLTICAARACLESGLSPLTGKGSNPDEEDPLYRFVCVEERNDEVIHRLNVVIKPAQLPRIRNLVFGLYRRHRVGRNEPSSSLFRISDALDQLGTPEEIRELPGATLPFSVWPTTPKFPGDEEQDFALVASKDSTNYPGQADFCIFVMNPGATAEGISPDALLQSKQDWHFQVTRFSRESGKYRACNSKDFISYDQGLVTHKLAALVEHFRTEENRERSPSSEPLRFWRAAHTGERLLNITNQSRIPNVLDAILFAESLPHRKRTKAMSWRKPNSRWVLISKDGVRRSDDGTYSWTHPKAPARSDDEGESVTNGEIFAVSRSKFRGRVSPIDLTSDNEDTPGEDLIPVRASNTEQARAEPSNSQLGKRRVKFTELEPEAGPSTSKRPRVLAKTSSQAELLSDPGPSRQAPSLELRDCLTDEEFEWLSKEGALG